MIVWPDTRKGGDTLNTRIKKLRKALDLTQQAFADRIGTSQNVLANYKTGRRNPSSSVINNICKEFHINEAWLRTGEGAMFRELSRDDEIAAFVNDVLREEPDDFRRRFIVALSHLSPVGWAALEQFVGDMTTRKLNPAPHAWRTFKPARPEDWLPDLEELDSPDAGIPPPSEPNRHLDAPPRAAPGWTPEKHAVWEAEARAEAERVYREILEEKKAESESSAFPPGGSGTA